MQRLTEVYSIISTLFENNETIIYRAARRDDGLNVILKTHKNPQDIHKIKHSFELQKEFNIPGASNVIGIFDNNEDPAYLVSEDKGGIVLEDYIKEYTPTELEFLLICENAARALGEIHAQKIVHRDVKPANMVIDPDTLDVWYIDFGISVRVKQSGEVRNEQMAGTLEYMSPEQTGRISSPVDYRSDIYSLGVVLYRLLTKEFPFAGKTPMELIHAHIAVTPTPPDQVVATQPIISGGIMKMLEKKPSNRYQTAESLVYDIKRCLDLTEHGENASAFMLAEKDIFHNIESGAKLYGKDDSIRSMKNAFDHISNTKIQMLLVEGDAAVGKTELLNELERYAEQKNSLIFRAEFDSMERNEPYYALREAFSHFESMMYGSHISLSSYREKILEQLGENAQALISILPQMEGILGKQPPVPHLSPQETQVRAEQVFRIFMQIICNVPCPCVFMLDNMQWVDESTLRLIFAAIGNHDLNNCLIVFSYRNENNITGEHMGEYTKHLDLKHTIFTSVYVRPLSAGEITHIIEDIFPMEHEDAEDLAETVYGYAKGDLQLIHDYLKELYHAGAIRFNEARDGWEWDRNAVDTQALEEKAGAIRKVYSSFSDKTQYCIDMLTCLGNGFDREMIEAAFDNEIPVDQVLELIRPAIDLGYIVYNEKYGTYSADSNRTRNTAYDLIPEDKRQQYNFIIAYRLYMKSKNSKAQMIKHCARITDLFDRSGTKIATQVDRDRVRHLNTIAADNAMETSDIDRAFRFYQTAINLLPENAFESNYDEALHLYLSSAATKFSMDDREGARQDYSLLEKHVGDKDDLYKIYRQHAQLHMSSADWLGAEAVIREYLRDSPYMIDEDGDIDAAIRPEYEKLLKNMDEKGLASFLEAPQAQDSDVRSQGSMLSLLAETTLMNINPAMRYYLYKAVNLAFEHGLFPDIVIALALGAERHANQGDIAQANQTFEIGLELAKKLNAPQSSLWAVYCSVIVHWVKPFHEFPDIYQHAKQITMMEGSLQFGAFADLMLLSYNIFAGVPLSQVLKEIDSAIYNAEKANFPRFLVIFKTGFRQFVRCMTGRTQGMDSFDDRMFNEEETVEETHPILWAFNSVFYYTYRMQALYTNGYYSRVLEYADQMEKHGPPEDQTGAFLIRVQMYYYPSLAMIRLCEQDPDLLDTYMPRIRHNQSYLKKYADDNPENFLEEYKLIETELLRLKNANLALVNIYGEIGIKYRERNCLWDEAIVEEIMLSFWKKRGLLQYQEVHTRNARELYEKLGARVKIIQLMGDADDPSSSDTTTTTTTTILTSTGMSFETDLGAAASLDYQAILNVISCLTMENGLSNLLNQLLSLLMRNGGAEQALLFLTDKGNIMLHAFKYSEHFTHGLISSELPLNVTGINETVVPRKLIELAANKNTRLVANSADNEYSFLGDPYLEKHAPESFICMPIVAHGEQIGLVYLENAQLSGVFPEHRVRFLNTVVLQSSLMIKNAINVDELETYTQDLEKRIKSYISQLNTLIAGIAHEINSPLGVCVTVASRLYERTCETRESFSARQLSKTMLQEYLEECYDGLDILSNNITRAGSLVQNFKKISVHQSNEVFEEVLLLGTIRSIIDYIRPAVKKQIESYTISGPEELRFFTSTGALAQIFTNLIMNSSIHAFAGREKVECQVNVDVTENQDSIQIVYSDNGRGMSEEEQEQVFMPFFTTRRSDGGSGLGGHIILSLVTQTLGGSIYCVSTPGAGTSFIMRLPKLTEAPRREIENV